MPAQTDKRVKKLAAALRALPNHANVHQRSIPLARGATLYEVGRVVEDVWEPLTPFWSTSYGAWKDAEERLEEVEPFKLLLEVPTACKS